MRSLVAWLGVEGVVASSARVCRGCEREDVRDDVVGSGREKMEGAEKKKKGGRAGHSKLGGQDLWGRRGVEERTTAQLISSLQACFCCVVGVGGLWLRAAVLIN